MKNLESSAGMGGVDPRMTLPPSAMTQQ